MHALLEAAIGFPAFLFTTALLVVTGFWMLVILGAAGPDAFDTDAESAGLGTLTVGGVPLAVSVSLMTVTGWLITVCGSLLLEQAGAEGLFRFAAGLLLLAAALAAAWASVRALARPLRALFPDEPAPSRTDFVGMTCTVRTGRVDTDFGQAEVTAADGSSAVVQVRRQAADGPLTYGSTGLLYAYDEPGEFFWVAPFDMAIDQLRG